MGLKISWTKRASRNYLNILKYIVENFGSNSGLEYQNKIENLVALLVKFPELGVRQSQAKGLRAIILYSRTKMFYTFNQKTLTIVNVVDSRND